MALSEVSPTLGPLMGAIREGTHKPGYLVAINGLFSRWGTLGSSKGLSYKGVTEEERHASAVGIF